MVRPSSTSAVRVWLSSRSSIATIARRHAAKSSFVVCNTTPLTFPYHRPFSTTNRRFDSPRSPFAVFVETLKTELRKNQELQENMRQLSGDVGKMQDSETMKKMRDAYERARIITSIQSNPKLQAAAEQLRKSGGKVGDAVGATLKQMEESELIKTLGAISSRLARQLDDSTAPIRNTQAYKQLSETLTEAFDDGGSALRIVVGEGKQVEQVRRIKREARLRKIGRPMPSGDLDSKEAADAVFMRYAAKEEGHVGGAGASASQGTCSAGAEGAEQAKPETTSESNSDPSSTSTTAPSPPKKPAGYAARSRTVTPNSTSQSLVLRPEPAYKQAWSRFKSTHPLFRRLADLSESYRESENPVIERVRGVSDWFGSLFEENDFARVTRQMKLLDPSFNLESFQRDLREYIVPELIDSYHSAARHLLRQWCGEATFNLLMATIDPYLSKGLIPEGRLLDLKHVEILHAKVLDNNIPVLVVSFTTQELMFFKDPKTAHVKAGNQNQPDLCRYAIVLTRVHDELDNQLTGGWKVIELARRATPSYL